MWLKGAGSLHNRMLDSILRSTMQFFESTPSGRILNRFSKDVDATEKGIPDSFRRLLITCFQVLSSLVVISSVTPLFILPLVPIAVLYLLMRSVYIKSVRQLKRMHSVSRSPIFSHFSECLTGVSTIRAFKEQEKFVGVNEQHIDRSSMFFFPVNIADRWLSLRLDLIKSLLILFASLFAVLARDYIDPSMAALSITYALNVTLIMT
jgi:ATP-binding cassette subfamily C (CFTR/MRP) protein 1